MHSRDSLSSLCFEVLLRMLMLVIYWRRFCRLRNSLLCTWDCGTRAWGGLPWLRSVNVAFSFSVINLPLFVHAGESAAGFVLLHTKGAITCQHPKCPHHQIHLQAHLNFFSILSVSWAWRLVCSFFRNLDFLFAATEMFLVPYRHTWSVLYKVLGLLTSCRSPSGSVVLGQMPV